MLSLVSSWTRSEGHEHLVHVDLDVKLPLAALRLALQEAERRRFLVLPQRPDEVARLRLPVLVVRQY